MKLFAYACRPFDEEPFFLQHAEELGVELELEEKVSTVGELAAFVESKL